MITLNPFEVQDHPDDGEIRWYGEKGDLLDFEEVKEELLKHGIKFKIKDHHAT